MSFPSTSVQVRRPPHPLKADSYHRYVLFPIQRHRLWDLYKNHEKAFWTAEEIDLSRDYKGWDLLTDGEKYFLKHVIAFFAASDGIVFENLATNFVDEVQVSEARAFYGFQAAMETIHSEVYSLLIDTYVKGVEEQMELFAAIEKFPSIKKKAEWAQKWMTSETPFVNRLIAFAAVEGIYFSGSFCAIFWLKTRGIDMPGLFLSNEFISRDEGLHTEFACVLYTLMCEYEQWLLKNEPDSKELEKTKFSATQEEVEDIIRSAVEIEKEFIIESIPVALVGMNADLMSQYIEYVADRLVIMLGHEPIFQSANPFNWMMNIGLSGKTNFFEKRAGDYGLSNVNVDNQPQSTEFKILDEF